MTHDPVCGLPVEAEEGAPSFEFRGETYYFCSQICKRKFILSPSAFLEEPPMIHRGWCGPSPPPRG